MRQFLIFAMGAMMAMSSFAQVEDKTHLIKNAGSGGQPIVALDGIKLYKIGEANPTEILQAMINDCNDLAGQATALGYDGLAGQIGDYSFELEGIDTVDLDAFSVAVDAANAVIEKFRAAIAESGAMTGSPNESR